MTKAQKAERAEAIETLRGILKPGDTVLTVLRHVSRSGMQREISLHKADRSELLWLSGLAARAMGYRLGKRDGIIAGGCGMDMGFHLVYNLSRTLFSDGFGCIGRSEGDGEGRGRFRCPSNDHSNGDRDFTPHGNIVGCEVGVSPCTCHDDGAWKIIERPTAEGGRIVTYAHGCSTCGCHRADHTHRDGGYALNHRWI